MKHREGNAAAQDGPARSVEKERGGPFLAPRGGPLAAPGGRRPWAAAAPLAARLLLIGALCAYFPAAALPPARQISRAAAALGARVSGGADMGGMETPYGEAAGFTGGEPFAENPGGAPEDPPGLDVTPPLSFFAYRLQPGDMIGGLSTRYGLNQDTLISANGIRNTRAIQAGREIRIPNQDGVIHKTAPGETLESVAARYGVGADPIVAANELFGGRVNAGLPLFVPGAKLNQADLQEINGDMFIWPARGRISSRYGWRISPISGKRGFHSGLDIAAPQGTPVSAGMAGRVTAVAYSAIFGNYVILSHHSNYRTLYAHLHTTRVRPGAYVGTGQTVGTVGNTGQSTGPHLHFQVYKNGATVNPANLMH